MYCVKKEKEMKRLLTSLKQAIKALKWVFERIQAYLFMGKWCNRTKSKSYTFQRNFKSISETTPRNPSPIASLISIDLVELSDENVFLRLHENNDRIYELRKE